MRLKIGFVAKRTIVILEDIQRVRLLPGGGAYGVLNSEDFHVPGESRREPFGLVTPKSVSTFNRTQRRTDETLFSFALLPPRPIRQVDGPLFFETHIVERSRNCSSSPTTFQYGLGIPGSLGVRTSSSGRRVAVIPPRMNSGREREVV